MHGDVHFVLLDTTWMWGKESPSKRGLNSGCSKPTLGCGRAAALHTPQAHSWVDWVPSRLHLMEVCYGGCPAQGVGGRGPFEDDDEQDDVPLIGVKTYR